MHYFMTHSDLSPTVKIYGLSQPEIEIKGMHFFNPRKLRALRPRQVVVSRLGNQLGYVNSKLMLGGTVLLMLIFGDLF